jgi:hypothetical protein
MKTAIHILALTALWTLVGWVSVAQTAPTPPAPPTLSTADRTAIGAEQLRQQEAQKEYGEASQIILAIEREWGAAHPGWRIDPQTFAVEADPKPEAHKETKKP